MKHSRTWHALVTGATVLSLAACGSGPGGDTTPDTPAVDTVADAPADVPGSDLDVPRETGGDAPADPGAADEGVASGEDVGAADAIDVPDTTVADAAVDAADLPGDEDAAPACGGLEYSADPACQDCIVARCCAELANCDVGTPCGGLLACLGACADGDGACQQACADAAGTEAMTVAQDLGTCDADSCAGPCRGAICDSGLQVPAAPHCGNCLGTNCCREFAACAQDQPCLDCIAGVPGGDCPSNAPWLAATDCLAAQCPSDCAPLRADAVCDSGLHAKDATCGGCSGTQCCSAFRDCAADATCRACWEGTTTAGCDANPPYVAANQCQTQSCAEACGIVDPGICGLGISSGAWGCNHCLTANCCGDLAPCVQDATCLSCLTGGTATGCETNVLYDAAMSCMSAQCGDAC